MTMRTLSTALIAIALAAPAAGAFADQPFGRDSVYAAGTSTRAAATSGAAVRNEAQPNGRDTVSAARIPGNGQPSTSTAEFVQRPGRA
jgi:hypothetical protein